jgi:hypothetical protein
LKHDIIPFIIDEEHKNYYYRGLKEFKHTPGYLIDTCLSAQDRYKEYLAYFQLDQDVPVKKQEKHPSVDFQNILTGKGIVSMGNRNRTLTG